jgi:hypothetical protein
MYGQPLVPPTFQVPHRLVGAGYHLRMLSIDDVDKDFEAVMASEQRLRGLLDPESPWPTGLTKREDLIDLAWHEREFTLRRSFAYTVMSADEAQCLGCMYIFPSDLAPFSASVFYWVRDGKNAYQFDFELGGLIRHWITAVWPFTAVAYPGRDVSWAQWQALKAANATTDTTG